MRGPRSTLLPNARPTAPLTRPCPPARRAVRGLGRRGLCADAHALVADRRVLHHEPAPSQAGQRPAHVRHAHLRRGERPPRAHHLGGRPLRVLHRNRRGRRGPRPQWHLRAGQHADGQPDRRHEGQELARRVVPARQGVGRRDQGLGRHRGLGHPRQGHPHRGGASLHRAPDAQRDHDRLGPRHRRHPIRPGGHAAFG